VIRGYGRINLRDAQAAAWSFLPAEKFIYSAMFSRAEDRDSQTYFLYESRSSSLNIHFTEHNRAFGPLRTMDDIVFYQPNTAPRRQPLRLPGAVTASHLPPGPIASPARQTSTLVPTLADTSDWQSRNAKQGTCCNLPWKSQLLTAETRLHSLTNFSKSQRRR
jgi:hypothetical protein